MMEILKRGEETFIGYHLYVYGIYAKIDQKIQGILFMRIPFIVMQIYFYKTL